MSNDTKTLNAIVKRVATRTADAYSCDRYGQRAWRESIKTLLREYTEAETETLLRSKLMRVAADWHEGARGRIPLNTIAMYHVRNRDYAEAILSEVAESNALILPLRSIAPAAR